MGFDGKTYDLNEDKYGVLGILDSLGVSVMLKAGFLTFMRNISERRNIKCVFIFLNCTSDYAVILK